ncbi:MAG: SCP2 sterol-binding domain-containing protein [Egibacteraceae bacterium]
MSRLDEHPTVRRYRARGARQRPPRSLDAEWLRTVCLDAGAEDVGFVEIDRPELADQRADIAAAFPNPKALISFALRLNRENIRSPARSAANLEFHRAGDETNDVARRIVATLEAAGVRGMSCAMGFPMEMDRFPSKVWVVAHKPVAVAAGLGHMGIHRNVIHPRLGSFVLLGTVVIDTEIDTYSQPLDYNPCLECNLCVAACPTGAISADGHFNFSACYTHNYREFMTGFGDWVEQIADSRDALDYRRRVADSQTLSMWQSLSFGANYKAAYCMAVCPAGEDVIGPYLADRKAHVAQVVQPLRDKRETVYVVPHSDAEDSVTRRFPHKTTTHVAHGIRPRTIDDFALGLRLLFQRQQARGLDACYHFTFTGDERRTLTVVIGDRTLSVTDGHTGVPDLRVTADTRTWLRLLASQTPLAWALVRGRIRLRGNPRLLAAFGRCFPS